MLDFLSWRILEHFFSFLAYAAISLALHKLQHLCVRYCPEEYLLSLKENSSLSAPKIYARFDLPLHYTGILPVKRCGVQRHIDKRAHIWLDIYQKYIYMYIQTYTICARLAKNELNPGTDYINCYKKIDIWRLFFRLSMKRLEKVYFFFYSPSQRYN